MLLHIFIVKKKKKKKEKRSNVEKGHLWKNVNKLTMHCFDWAPYLETWAWPSLNNRLNCFFLMWHYNKHLYYFRFVRGLVLVVDYLMLPLTALHCIVFASTYWQSKWKAAGQRSQQSRSPPSLQLSQQSWLTALPRRCSTVLPLRLDRREESSLIGGATSLWICWKYT